MILGTSRSRNGILIRLTQERWTHITYSHPEIPMSESEKILHIVKKPEYILKGDRDELLAVKKSSSIKSPGIKFWYVVAYKEINSKDGFILTAYITTDDTWLFKRKILWIKQ